MLKTTCLAPYTAELSIMPTYIYSFRPLMWTLFVCLFVFLALQPIVVVFSQPSSGEGRGVHKVLVGKPEVTRPLGRPRRRWEDNIKRDLGMWRVWGR
jgi:hypothetical protein